MVDGIKWYVVSLLSRPMLWNWRIKFLHIFNGDVYIFWELKKNCCSITLCILIFSTIALIITFSWMSQFKTPSVVMLSVVMQNVVMVSVVARLEWLAVADIWKIYRTEMEGENSEITKRNKMLNGGTLSRKSYCGIQFFKFSFSFLVQFCPFLYFVSEQNYLSF